MTGIITILLAAYNGEKFIQRQVDSILSQTYADWRLIIRDDGSTDHTLSIIRSYQKQHPDKIEVMINDGTNKGSLSNFSALLQAAAGAEYIMFCDQDDEWKHDKIEITFAKMKELEKLYGHDHPLLIFTNFQYVDENMNIIASKKDFEINRFHQFGFPQSLAQNPVYGCTTLMNRALANTVGTIPLQADFHDHWIALIATALGTVYYMKEKTVFYRQHGNNVSGSFDNNSFKKRVQRILVSRKNAAEAKNKYIMLVCFKGKYGKQLDENRKRILNDFLCFYKNKDLVCLMKSIRSNIRSQTLAQSVLLYTTVLFTKMPS